MFTNFFKMAVITGMFFSTTFAFANTDSDIKTIHQPPSQESQKASPVLQNAAWKSLLKYKSMKLQDKKLSIGQERNCPKDANNLAKINVGDVTPEFKLFNLDPKTGTEDRPMVLGFFYNTDGTVKMGSTVAGPCENHMVSKVTEESKKVTLVSTSDYKCKNAKFDKFKKTTMTIEETPTGPKLTLVFDPAGDGYRFQCTYVGQDLK